MLCGMHDARHRRALASPKKRGAVARRQQQCRAEGCLRWHLPGDKKNGRKLGGRWYCREHEALHLVGHPRNLERLAEGIRVQDECWVYRRSWANEGPESEDYHRGGYAKFYPAGTGAGTSKRGNPYDAAWAAHRALWDLLMGGTKLNRQLDHLDDCTAQAACCNPAHLEPVTEFVNKKRGTARREVEGGHKARTVRECGPRFNKEAALNPKVRQFARDNGDLPLPVVEG